MPILVPQQLEQAGTLVTIIRDLMPDPVYQGPTPQPDSDGPMVRAQTLYRWLTLGIRDMARRIGYQHEDWWAQPLQQDFNTYTLDARWRHITECFVNQYFCVPANETRTIWPANSATVGSQATVFDQHRMNGQVTLYIYPGAGASDPITTMTTPISATDTLINVASTQNFLSYGYVQIDSELIQYQRVSGNQLQACRRGVAGSSPSAYPAGAIVVHCGLWVKGVRAPNPVAISIDFIEMPHDALDGLVEFVLAEYARFEQDTQMATYHRNNYHDLCDSIKRDPRSQQAPGAWQVAPYGGYGGGLGWYDGVDGVVVR